MGHGDNPILAELGAGAFLGKLAHGDIVAQRGVARAFGFHDGFGAKRKGDLLAMR